MIKLGAGGNGRENACRPETLTWPTRVEYVAADVRRKSGIARGDPLLGKVEGW